MSNENAQELFLLKLGEVVLKGLNRRTFEDKLVSNVCRRVRHCGSFNVYLRQSTIYVEPQNDECDMRETLRWLDQCGDFSYVKPILTPRFTPSCTDELLAFLGKLAAQRNLPVQSHLSENTAELEWVRRLHPDCEQYWQTYAKYGLWTSRTAMRADKAVDLYRVDDVFHVVCFYSHLRKRVQHLLPPLPALFRQKGRLQIFAPGKVVNSRTVADNAGRVDWNHGEGGKGWADPRRLLRVRGLYAPILLLFRRGFKGGPGPYRGVS